MVCVAFLRRQEIVLPLVYRMLEGFETPFSGISVPYTTKNMVWMQNYHLQIKFLFLSQNTEKIENRHKLYTLGHHIFVDFDFFF